MMNCAIEASELSIRRSGRQILRELSWQVPVGSISGVLGPSGSGKTTLLRAVIGAQRHTGTLQVLGRPAGSADLRRRIGYVTQTASVYDDLTVAENLHYFAAVVGADRDQVGEVLTAVGLADRQSDLVRRLSGGQRARVSLAVALLGTPELLVLDEPTVGLDPVLRAELWALFAELAGRGATLLVSSHVMDEAERCDALLLLRDGAALAMGESPAELCRRTSTGTVEQAFLHLVAA